MDEKTNAQAENGASAERSQAEQFKDSARDEALSAAEKGLQAAREALEAAERKLAEAQRQAAYNRAETTSGEGEPIDVEPVESSSVRTEAAEAAGAAARAETTAADAASDETTAAGATRAEETSQPASEEADQAATQSAPYETGAYQQQAAQANAASQGSAQAAGSTGQAYYQQQQPNSAPNYQNYQQPPVQPHYNTPVVSRDHVAAGLLAIFLGGLGIHKFYLGYSTQGFIMLALSLLGGLFSFGLVSCIVWVIAVIEGIIYLTKSQSEFERIYVYSKREWF